MLSIISNLQPTCYLKIDFQKVDQSAGGKWLIHYIMCLAAVLNSTTAINIKSVASSFS